MEKITFSKKLLLSDLFFSLSLEEKILYFELVIRADNEGFVSTPKGITKMIGVDISVLENLTKKGFIIYFLSGVIVITHWYLHNEYRELKEEEKTIYNVEKSQLQLDHYIYKYTEYNNDTSILLNNSIYMNTQYTSIECNNNKSINYTENDNIHIDTNSINYTDSIKYTKNKKEEKELEKEKNNKLFLEKEQEKKKTNPATSRFVPPTLQEVDDLIKEKHYSFSAISFWSFYESKGWKVGKNTMKSWKSCCDGWEQRYQEKYGIKENPTISKIQEDLKEQEEDNTSYTEEVERLRKEYLEKQNRKEDN